MSGEPYKLTPAQVELVLRRAAEIEARSADENALLSPSEVDALAQEVGLSSTAVREALAEVRAGVVARPSKAKAGWLERLREAHVAVERRIGASSVEVQARITRLLRGQLFHIQRNFGERIVWEHELGWFSQARRAIDPSGRYFLAGVAQLEVTVLEVDRLVCRVVLRSAATGLDPLLAGTTLTVAAVAGLAVADLERLLPLGVLAGAASFFAALRERRRKARQLHNVLERTLDYLEHGTLPESSLHQLLDWM